MIDQKSVESLEHLHRLKTEGIITEEEFERSKQQLLFGPKPSTGLAAIMTPQDLPLPAEEDHVGWITMPIKRYADFTGRSCRKEFWMFQLIYAAAGVAIFAAASDQDTIGDIAPFGRMMIGSGVLVLIGLLVPLLAVEARRFHDQNRSGWFVLLNLIPYLGPLIVLAMMLIPGTPGDNSHGPDPLAAPVQG
jgi:uncharacterized membrane protein YhaH (DUF805 family)